MACIRCIAPHTFAIREKMLHVWGRSKYSSSQKSFEHLLFAHVFLWHRILPKLDTSGVNLYSHAIFFPSTPVHTNYVHSSFFAQASTLKMLLKISDYSYSSNIWSSLDKIVSLQTTDLGNFCQLSLQRSVGPMLFFSSFSHLCSAGDVILHPLTHLFGYFFIVPL